VVINKTEIRNNADIAGIAAVNILGSSIISQVIIGINRTMGQEHLLQVNGIVVHYKEWGEKHRLAS